MGTRATWRFCQLLTDELAGKKEWDHPPLEVWIEPQIPSRTRALLYNEKSPVPALAQRLADMAKGGVTHVALPCNSIHYWRDEVVERLSTHFQIEDLTWLDMLTALGPSAPPDTLVVGGYVTMAKKLYGPKCLYPMDEYAEIYQMIEWLRIGCGVAGPLTALLDKLEQKYQPCRTLLACTEFALGDVYWSKVPLFDSSNLYAKAVAQAWNRLSS